MKGLTSPLWPIHFKPLPDELLSSWLVRLAHSHGLKVQTFCNLLFGNTHQLWNRDIDRLAPDWLLQALSDRTGTPLEQVFQSTLRSYEGWLYPKMRTSSTLQWITVLKLNHRRFDGYGIQYCPQCLAEDAEPHFRKCWRVSFNTICVKHSCRLLDRCQNCGSGAAFHRVDVGNKKFTEITSLAICHHCGFNLQTSKPIEINAHSPDLREWLVKQSTALGLANKRAFDCDTLNVTRHLVMLLTSRHRSIRLYEFVCNQLSNSGVSLKESRCSFESRPTKERHHLIQLAGWLQSDLDLRLALAWQQKAVRYNHLLKDFERPPKWYQKTVYKFSHWRTQKRVQKLLA